MNRNEILNKYIDLILKTGIDLQKGQNIYLQFEPYHWDFASRLATQAYKLGANFVDTDCVHQSLVKARIENAPDDSLEYLPEYYSQRFIENSKAPWSRIAIKAPEDPDALAGLNQSRNAKVQKALRKASEPMMKALGAGKLPWLVCALPTQKWAAKILGCEASPQAEEKLWDILIPILRLDSKDPIATWKDLALSLKKRAHKLNDHKFEKLHFEAPGTDLWVYLIAQSHWAGGAIGRGDREFIPNLPTEEVFTSPDWSKTHGKAKVTRPVEVFGSQVEGAYFEFQNGKVINCGAQVGEEQLKAFVAADAQASFLGEVALVDGHSPIFKSGKIFHSILYDENAACHVALGAAYPIGVEDKNLSKDELLKLGYNQSLVHTDFMIGCPEMNVTGFTSSGKAVPILNKGNFSDEFA
ncbi:MAG: aminopeptidase [Proteobacteria bacterium]|nr:aminopeptidase [Pseudomonadota bacterium]